MVETVKMKKEQGVFPTSFALGLVACLRQASLSIHRTNSLNELRSYYDKEKYSLLTQILNFLWELGFNSKNVGVGGSLCYLSKCKIWLNWTLFNRVSISNHVLSRVVRELESILKTLEGDIDFSDEGRVRLRMNIDQAIDLVSEYIPNQKLLGNAQEVSHLNQADHLGLKDISEIVGGIWYKKKERDS